MSRGVKCNQLLPLVEIDHAILNFDEC